MGHGHDHSNHKIKDHNHSHHHSSASKNLAWAFVLNLFFSIFELLGGIYSNSIAIISDAFHDFGDAFSLAFVWYLQKVSTKPIDRHFDYGYKRFSILGALIISVLLSVGSVFMIIESVKRFLSPAESKADVMFLLAIVGVVVNGIAMFRLQHGSSFSEKAVFLHFLEDILGWIAVLFGSILMYFWEVPWIDPLLSLGIAIWILYNAYGNTKQVMRIFLQAVPVTLDRKDLIVQWEQIKGVKSVHDIKIWSLDGNQHVASLHVLIDKKLKPNRYQSIKEQIRNIAIKFAIVHTTIEIETDEEICNLQLP
ncbi:cation diffusion facilitator family transporter [Leptospira yanagawae serovar Saopaulo str. Sao Paulo = ATCC 700523]|uniref:Cation diffusion facilitator family transporter n=1 Tax=Leptospira yanagawae serovar Saopaulo str. Sao Paulo = ATCC 700523 TaxID=1249483 RepID=A0A5E8HDY8_9LEPT|nr:cation diffusion facilitator family transporter [Leptospira yanagawae]EOQ89459.1 cation diffusion facilitator family transporter [Leptospira yanagawae serovar Saopaulo str. Sao Paulo = ATCC 700523]